MLAAFSGYLQNFFSPYLDLKQLCVKMWICCSQQVQQFLLFRCQDLYGSERKKSKKKAATKPSKLELW